MYRVRMLAFVLIFSLCFSIPVWAVSYSDLYDSDGYAKQIDTYSLFPRVSSSNAPVTAGLNDYVMPASSVGTVTNTVDFSGAKVSYKDDVSGKWKHGGYVSLGGTFSFIVPSGERVSYFSLNLNPSASLPALGKYQLKVDFSSDTSLDYRDNAVLIQMIYRAKNATAQPLYYTVPSNHISSSSGDIYFITRLNLMSNVSDFDIRYDLKSPVASGGAIGGKFSINFSAIGSDESVNITSPGTAPSSTDTQANIASQTTQIAYSVNQVYDSILALTQHISDQLAAFWDQLYNYIHVPTFNKLQEILKAIQAIQLKVNVDVSSVVDAVDTSADRITGTVNSAINNQISNDDKNTNDLKNGYDNSGMLSDNDRLNDKISQYDEVENQLFDDAKDKIGNFTFDNPLSKYTAVLSDISYFLAGIYEGLGALNIPIGFSLTLTIALIFIGYYRFKGGV